MRLLWILTLALALIVAFAFRDVNGDEHHKKGSGLKDLTHRTGVQSPTHNVHRDHSSSSSKLHGQKHKNKKHGKNKKHHDGKKHLPGGKKHHP